MTGSALAIAEHPFLLLFLLREFLLCLDKRLEILFYVFVSDTFELFNRYQRKELPAKLKRILDAAVVVLSLAHVSVLEIVRKFRESLILVRKSAFYKDAGKLLGRCAACGSGEELVH